MITPFTAEDLAVRVFNDEPTYDRLCRAVTRARDAIQARAIKAAKENADWHDDPSKDDHAIHHAPAEEQFPPALVAQCLADCLVYLIRETVPEGQKIRLGPEPLAQFGAEVLAIMAAPEWSPDTLEEIQAAAESLGLEIAHVDPDPEPAACPVCGGGEVITMTDGKPGWRCGCSDQPIAMEGRP